MDASNDHVMTDPPTAEESYLPLSFNEQQALQLWDKLQDLRLEIAIINAQKTHQDDPDVELTTEEVDEARNNLLETRGLYLMRNQVIESTLSANPILKAVHGASDASQVERDLLAHVKNRDEITIKAAKATSEMSSIRDETTAARVSSIKASRQNKVLAAQIMDLVEQVNAKKTGHKSDPRSRQGMEHLEEELKSSRQRWRVLKSVASGVVVGSGVDWGRNEGLRDMVLDSEDEDEDEI